MNFRKVNNITGLGCFPDRLHSPISIHVRQEVVFGIVVSLSPVLTKCNCPTLPVRRCSHYWVGFLSSYSEITPRTAANAVNIMSALASAATILFLFWTHHPFCA